MVKPVNHVFGRWRGRRCVIGDRKPPGGKNLFHYNTVSPRYFLSVLV